MAGKVWRGAIRHGELGRGLAGKAGCVWVRLGTVWRGSEIIKHVTKGEEMETGRAYEWSVDIYGIDANEAGKVMEGLEKTVGLTKKSLVDASRPEDAPLHKAFEWDDSIAGEKYREIQAGKMITNLKVVTKVDETKKTRGFVSLEYGVGKPGVFESTEKVLSVTEKKNRLLTLAIRDLQAFRKKYISLSELGELFEVMDKLLKETA